MSTKYFVTFLSAFFMLFFCAFAQQKTNQLPENGTHKIFYSNGSIKEKGRYKNSQKQGVWYFYTEKGVVEKKEKYKKGELRWQIFYNKGKITKTIDRDGKVVERPKCGC